VTKTYLGGAQVDRAQAVLDVHVVAIATGRCIGCGEPGPCAERELASRVFRRSQRLPHRPPGASRPELCGAVRVGAPGWLN
jgi:hypothetical protein